jgi:hypothetical protein
VPTSVRLDAKTEALLWRLARQTGRTRSRIIREAIAQFAQGGSGARSPYSIVADLIGIARGGPPDLGRRSTQVFKKILAARARR